MTEIDYKLIFFSWIGADQDPRDCNIDIEVQLADGKRYSATVFTAKNVSTLMDRWAKSGEYGGGEYFWCPDGLIIRDEMTKERIRRVIDYIAREGCLDQELSLLEEEPDDDKDWRELDFDARWERLQEIRESDSLRDRSKKDLSGGVYALDGSAIDDIPSLYLALGETINGPGGYFGACLDSLSDCLCGGFSAIPPFQLIIENSQDLSVKLDERAWLQWVLKVRLDQVSHPDLSMSDLEDLGLFQALVRPQTTFLERVVTLLEEQGVHCELK